MVVVVVVFKRHFQEHLIVVEYQWQYMYIHLTFTNNSSGKSTKVYVYNN